MADDVALSLGEGLSAGLLQAVAQGYSRVEVRARAQRPAEEHEALADSGLLVVSAILAPTGPLGHPHREARRAILADLDRQLADAALLGAVCVCLDSLPPSGPAHAAWVEALEWLADRASRRMLRLAVTADVGTLGRWLEGPEVGCDFPARLLAVRLADEGQVSRFLPLGVIVSVLQSPQTSSSTSSLT